MPKIRAGKTFIEAVVMECPHCGGFVSEPVNRSLMWTQEDNAPGTIGHCDSCGADVRLPADAYGRSRKEGHS